MYRGTATGALAERIVVSERVALPIGDGIPLGARIFALADALDAMTSDRPYRTALSWEQATDEILSHDGSQFDPKVVRAFCTRERQLHRIYEEFSAVAA